MQDKSLLTIAVDLVSTLSGVFQKKRAENWDSGGKDMVFDRVDRPTQRNPFLIDENLIDECRLDECT